MSQRIGPSVWSRLWTNFNRALTRGEPEKVYVASDSIGNKYFEYKHGRSSRSNIKRGYDAPGPNAPKPSLEWEAWLKGTRRFPPADEEIAINKMRQQRQLDQDSVTEKRAPKIASTGKGAGDIDRPRSFPSYDDMEITPGVKKTNQDRD